MFVLILVVGLAQGRAVRLRPRRATRSSGSSRSTGRSARSTSSRCSTPPWPGSVRDGDVDEVAVEAIVLDDLLELRTGDQVPADGIVRTTDGLEIDESLLTGESDPIDKHAGRRGALRQHRRRRGRALPGHPQSATTPTPASSPPRPAGSQLVHSELIDGINTILRFVTWAILPTAAAARAQPVPRPRRLAGGAHRDRRRRRGDGARGSRAAHEHRVRCWPSVTLARRKVLVQELPAVEGLARVDVVCLDKTGTLTDGNIVEFDRLEQLAPDATRSRTRSRRSASDENRNATHGRGRGRVPAPSGDDWERTGSVPFSSARKWSARQLRRPRHLGHRRARDGAGRGVDDDVSRQGRRARGDGTAGPAPRARRRAARRGGAAGRPAAGSRSCCSRSRCARTRPRPSRYFAEQGVTLKVISGDNPQTVGAVAQRVGLPDAGRPVRRPRAARRRRRARRGPRGAHRVRPGHARTRSRRSSRRCSRAATSWR